MLRVHQHLTSSNPPVEPLPPQFWVSVDSIMRVGAGYGRSISPPHVFTFLATVVMVELMEQINAACTLLPSAVWAGRSAGIFSRTKPTMPSGR